jgi:hypothetical protein
MTPVRLTRDIDRFVCRLKDGDVLLFDSLHLVSHMIKLADNSPVNHCGIYEEEGESVIEASPPGDDSPRKAIRRAPLRDRVKGRLSRTVTAFRHPDAGLGKAVVARAREWGAMETAYGYTDLLGLFAQCFNRSYGNTKYASLRIAFDMVSSLMQSASTVAGLGLDQRWSLTCSEFVYSVYIEVDKGSIEIRDPLSIWNDEVRWLDRYLPAPRPRRTPKYFDPTRAGASSDWFSEEDEAFSSILAGGIIPGQPDDAPAMLFTNRNGPPTEPPTEWTEGAGFEVGRDNGRRQLWRQTLQNLLFGKCIPRSSQTPETPWAEHVTPFDLWQSKSLHAVEVLHFPPLPGDPVRERGGFAATRANELPET